MGCGFEMERGHISGLLYALREPCIINGIFLFPLEYIFILYTTLPFRLYLETNLSITPYYIC